MTNTMSEPRPRPDVLQRIKEALNRLQPLADTNGVISGYTNRELAAFGKVYLSGFAYYMLVAERMGWVSITRLPPPGRTLYRLGEWQ